MAWSASAHSGALAGLVLTMVVGPRLLLALLGGAVADRVGAWPVMIAGDATLLVLTLGLAGAVVAVGPQPALLLTVALAIGVVDAFYLPASGSMPRRLVAPEGLARALAARQIGGQLAAVAGAPLGGALVAAAGLPAAALINAATFAVMLAVLLTLRPATPSDTRTAPPGAPLRRQASDGLTTVARDRLLRPALLLASAAAGVLLPVSSLPVPLLGHQRLWPPSGAGLVVGATAIGTAIVTLLMVARGAWSRPGQAAVLGLLLAAAGLGLLAVIPAVVGAALAGALIGVGTGVFTAHLGPILLGRAPATHLARVQAAVLVAQSAPLLLANTVLGRLADTVQPALLVGACGVALTLVALLALRSAALREIRTSPPQMRASNSVPLEDQSTSRTSAG
jgi:hypothetical protein